MLRRGGLWFCMVLFAATANSTPAFAQSAALEKLRKERDARRKKLEAEKAQKEAEAARKKAEEELKKAEEERKKAEEERKKAEEERKKAEAAAENDKPVASAASTAKPTPSAESAAAAPKAAAEKTEPGAEEQEIPAELASLRLSRDERRKELVQKLKERWGPLLDKPESRAELGAHARRVAFLQRMRTLAENDKKPKLVERIDKLLTSEELRHGKAMNGLR